LDRTGQGFLEAATKYLLVDADSPTTGIAGRYPGALFSARCAVEKEEEVDRFFKDAVTWAADDGLFGLINNAGVAQEGILASFPTSKAEKLSK